MKSDLIFDKEYKLWVARIKAKVCNTQIKAALSVNAELLTLYWTIGANIVDKQKAAKWGEGLICQLSKDLSVEFPDIKGFSLTNLKYMKQWFKFYTKRAGISQQPVGQFDQDEMGFRPH